VGKRRAYTDGQLAEAVKSSRTYAEVLSKLGLVPAGGNYATVQATVRRLGLSTTHMRGQGWARGRRVPARTLPKPLPDVLVENSTYQSYKLKRRLLGANVLEPICARCALAKWLGEPVPLELHHVNGVKTDNRLENLQLICPNCHALTGSFRGKNIR
jgi:hypothetical protein